MDEEHTMDIDPKAFFRRLFEPLPADWRTRFKAGDRVRLVRPDPFGFIPRGAEGAIIAIEPPDSFMGSKGRVYQVCFNLRPFNLRLCDRFSPSQLDHLRNLGVDPNELLLTSETNVSPLDIEAVD